MDSYDLRGVRVSPLSKNQIEITALKVANILKFSKRRKKQCDQGFESLSQFGVTLDVIDDDDWFWATKGHFDPSTMTISVPEKIYEDACLGERDALFVMLHEFGHLFLMHRPLLHSSSTKAKIEEDAEWQADTFAEAILQHMGYKVGQLTFDFHRM